MSVNKERKHHSSNKNYKQIKTMRLWKNMIKIEFNLENYEDVFIEGYMYLQNHEVLNTLIQLRIKLPVLLHRRVH